MDNRSLILYTIAVTLAAAVVTAPVACTVHRQRTIAEAIKAGADPISAKCAIEGSTSTSPMCIVAASRGGAR